MKFFVTISQRVSSVFKDKDKVVCDLFMVVFGGDFYCFGQAVQLVAFVEETQNSPNSFIAMFSKMMPTLSFIFSVNKTDVLNTINLIGEAIWKPLPHCHVHYTVYTWPSFIVFIVMNKKRVTDFG